MNWKLWRSRSGRTILAFGATSLLTDVAGEMIAPILPLFMGTVLGLDKIFIGTVEGIAEATSSLAKLVSGRISDRARRRKPIIIVGYSLSALAKPLLALVQSGTQVIGVRFADRLGKGIRTSPRDALLAESVPPERRGLAFGFHRAMDSAGAIIGPGIAALLLAAGYGHRSVFMWAFIPAVLAVVILLAVREDPRPRPSAEERLAADGKPFGRPFLVYLAACALFTLGNSSDAFLVLRAQNLGMALAAIPLMVMLQNLVNTVVSTPAGYLSDRVGRKGMILAGFGLYSLVYLGFAGASRAWQVWPLAAAYGLYYGIMEGSLRAFVADLVPRERLGTAYGLYHTVVGLCLLPASLMAGFLWERVGPAVPFLTGCLTAAGAAMLLLAVKPSSARG